MKIFNTINPEQTKELGELLAEEIKSGPASASRGGKIICLEGELGSGKTTFTQGLLKGLGVKGPYTSPTFTIIKHYRKKILNPKFQIQDIYHVDAYRVTAKNVLDIGWEEITADKGGIIIVEWANKIRKIIPKRSLWIKFKLIDSPRAGLADVGKNERKIILLSK